jgi:hypothetical protein
MDIMYIESEFLLQTSCVSSIVFGSVRFIMGVASVMVVLGFWVLNG